MNQLTIRSIIIGIIGSIIITTSSMYVALRMGALPWPTIFVAVLSMSLLKLFGNTNLNEINITHTAMSAGAMVAGGLAFTIPGIWIINNNAHISTITLLTITISGTLLGIIYTAIIRKYYIEDIKLTFPMGVAASETLVTSNAGGKGGLFLLFSMILSGGFTYIRDSFPNIIPPVIMSKYLSAKNMFFGAWVSPMAIGIGYIIGPLYTGVWFLGAMLSYFLIIPFGLSFKFFADMNAANAFKNSLGIGMMVGTGVGIPIKFMIPKLKDYFKNKKNIKLKREYKYLPFALTTLILFISVVAKLNIFATVLVVVLTFLTTAMSAQITGQTGINPMEIFGIIVLLFIRIFIGVDNTSAFLIVALVAVATGLAGDVLNDFKSGYILKTNPKAQFVAELFGGLVGAIVSVFVLIIMHRAYGSFGPQTPLPAPQAFAVSTMVGGIPNLSAFIIGFVAGLLLFLFNIPAMTLGIGIYLPMFISTTACIGGLLKYIINKVKSDFETNANIIASGFLGGEGIIGVALAIYRVVKGI